MPRHDVVQVSLTTGEHVMLYTPRAGEIFEHMDAYRIEHEQVSRINTSQFCK